MCARLEAHTTESRGKLWEGESSARDDETGGERRGLGEPVSGAHVGGDRVGAVRQFVSTEAIVPRLVPRLVPSLMPEDEAALYAATR